MANVQPSPLLARVQQIFSGHQFMRDALQNIASQSDTSVAVETLLQLCSGAPGSSGLTPALSTEEWSTARAHLLGVFDEHQPGASLLSNGKRSREPDAGEVSSSAAKKPRLVDDADDLPVFTLHGVSFTSPIRKKADITVHRSTLRFTDPKDPKSNICDPIPLEQLRRAFMVATPGKTKPHWTTIILPESSDTSVIFGCDATLSAPQITTKYPQPPQTHPKGSASKPLIHSLFAYFPTGPSGLLDLYEPKPADFQSGQNGSQSIDAYIGAKDGHLHFFSHGVLWGEKKPIIWFPLDEIVDMHTGISSGRSFTLYISTRAAKKKASGAVSNGKTETADDIEDDEPLEMHDFSLIDSKEETPVKKWIAAHKQQFAASTTDAGALSQTAGPSTSGSGTKTSQAPMPARPAGPVRLVDAILDESDEEDKDFAGSDDSNSDSGSDSEEEDGDQAEGGEDAEGEQEDEAMESEDEDPQAGSSTNDDSYRVQLPAGVKVSRAAAEAAQKMVGEAFGL